MVLGILSTALIVWRLQIYRKSPEYQSNRGFFQRILKYEERLVTDFQNRIENLFSSRLELEINPSHVLEILLIGIWALWVGREYLNFDPHVWPTGREFGIQVSSHNFWNQIRECGFCALWNGSINGGAPALSDPFGSSFHPFVMIPTLFLGIVNGVKVAALLTIWTAGISQWMLANLFQARRIVRLWSGTIAVVGGHILGRMELGAFGIMLSTTMASLSLFSIFYFAHQRNRLSQLMVAMTIALMLFSGHGYLQIGFLSSLPIIYLFKIKDLPREDRKNFLLALITGFLLASIILLPILHFSPQIEKWGDPDFELAQTLEYIPLNLLIHDWEFFTSDTLQKPPFPYLTNIFIGWIPFLLGLISLAFLSKKSQPDIFSLFSIMLLTLFLSSGIPFRWAARLIPKVAGIRHTQLIAGLMVPPLIGLGSYSAERLFRLEWPSISLTFPTGQSLYSLSCHWVLLIPLISSVYICYQFNQPFLKVKDVQDLYQSVQKIDLESSQWIGTPYGEHWWILASLENDQKITNVVAPWWWKSRHNPDPYFLLERKDPPEGMTQVGQINGIPAYINEENTYAYIKSGESSYPCLATARGGYISIECEPPQAGHLIIQENQWSGWKAWRDGTRVDLIGKQWLTVESPPGKHTFTFRYQPWDVPLGMILSVFGIVVSIGVWFYHPRGQKEHQEQENPE